MTAQVPDTFPLDSARLREATGGRLRWLASCDSTNRVARSLVEQGEDRPIVVAEAQEEGRGRLGRSWLADPGANLLFSIVLKPPVPAHEAPRCVLIWAAAMAEVLDVQLKWPNDLVDARGAKLGGLLAELVGRSGPTTVVLGVGINVNQMTFPGLPQATSLASLRGTPQDRTSLLLDLLVAIEAAPLTGEDLLAGWRARCPMLGTRVRVGEREGVATGLREDGALLLDGQPVLAGDVELVG
jgi:BirA family biotin operon repressor/biotin-[acetyl-CoA-carboxylase] ligase